MCIRDRVDTPHKVQKEVLPNGLVVITEPMEHVHSVSVGIWLRSGSRREPAELNGVSHFIEHMVFKGTTVSYTHLDVYKRQGRT